MKYSEYTQRFIEETLKEKKLQMRKQAIALDEIKEQKTKTIEFLESRRKQDEDTYLKPVLKQFEKQKQIMSVSLAEYTEALIEALHAFSVGLGTLSAQELLKEYMYCKHILKDVSKSVDEKAQCLFDYFLKIEDVLSASTFLKCRFGSEFTDEYDEQRERYLEHMAKHPEPIKASDVDCVDVDCITGYGEYKDDIIKLLRVCGQIDFKTKPDDYEGVYYSEQTKELIASASIGEFGKLCRHVYYDMPYGIGVCDSDRRILMYAHDKGYEIEQSIEKMAIESSLEL
ncbi:MAG: hypothetical protein IJ371_04715 [Clostridia bacterium]|nr:hypothetical protein [Clostridia bacterium]